MLWRRTRHRHAHRTHLRLPTAAAALVCLAGACSSPPTFDGAVVTEILDGDTIGVSINDTSVRVRLIGLDTPERGWNREPDECGALEATIALQELAPIGSTIDLKRDVVGRDHYDRLLAYVFTTEGIFVNERLLEIGAGRTMSIAPNTAFEDRFRRASARAQQQRIGIWGRCEDRNR